MGRFVKCGGRVVWEDPNTCDLYHRDKHGSWHLLFKLPIERNCPMMTAEQALKVRELQMKSFSGVSYAEISTEDSEEELLPPSLAFFDEINESFDYFWKAGFFTGHEDLLSHFLPYQLASLWQDVTNINVFLCQLALLRQDLAQTSTAPISGMGTEADLSVSYSKSVGETVDDGSHANLTSTKISSRSLEGASDKEPDQLSPQHPEPLEDPLSLNFTPVDSRKLRHGTNPNAMKAPQGKTNWEQKLKFYKSTKGAWVIWGDVHFSSQPGFDGSTAAWVYHCSRIKPKNPAKPKLDEIESIELNFPIKENNSTVACAGLRHCLESLGIKFGLMIRKRKSIFTSNLK